MFGYAPAAMPPRDAPMQCRRGEPGMAADVRDDSSPREPEAHAAGGTAMPFRPPARAAAKASGVAAAAARDKPAG